MWRRMKKNQQCCKSYHNWNTLSKNQEFHGLAESCNLLFRLLTGQQIHWMMCFCRFWTQSNSTSMICSQDRTHSICFQIHTMFKNNPHMLFTRNCQFNPTNHQTAGMNGKDRKWVSSYPHIKDELHVETCFGFTLRILNIRDQSDN